MPQRKMTVTTKGTIGTGENLSAIVRMEAATDPMNVGIVSLVVVARLDPATDLSAWEVGQTKIIDIDL